MVPEDEDAVYSDGAVDPTDQMAGEPEDDKFFEAASDAPEDVTPRAGHDEPVPGMARALREQGRAARGHLRVRDPVLQPGARGEKLGV